MIDTAGNIIESSFLYPCPSNCGLTGGCPKCRYISDKNTNITIPQFPPMNVPITIKNNDCDCEYENVLKNGLCKKWNERKFINMLQRKDEGMEF